MPRCVNAPITKLEMPLNFCFYYRHFRIEPLLQLPLLLLVLTTALGFVNCNDNSLPLLAIVKANPLTTTTTAVAASSAAAADHTCPHHGVGQLMVFDVTNIGAGNISNSSSSSNSSELKRIVEEAFFDNSTKQLRTINVEATCHDSSHSPPLFQLSCFDVSPTQCRLVDVIQVLPRRSTSSVNGIIKALQSSSTAAVNLTLTIDGSISVTSPVVITRGTGQFDRVTTTSNDVVMACRGSLSFDFKTLQDFDKFDFGRDNGLITMDNNELQQVLRRKQAQIKVWLVVIPIAVCLVAASLIIKHKLSTDLARSSLDQQGGNSNALLYDSRRRRNRRSRSSNRNRHVVLRPRQPLTESILRGDNVDQGAPCRLEGIDEECCNLRGVEEPPSYSEVMSMTSENANADAREHGQCSDNCDDNVNEVDDNGDEQKLSTL